MLRPLAGLALAGVTAAAVLLGSCTPTLFKAKPPPTETFGPTVDSVVVKPVDLGPDARMNTVDVNTFRQLLEAQLKTKQGIQAFQKAPTTLRNSATLDTTLLRYQIQDQTADTFLLRTVNLTATLTARLGNEKEPSIRLRRALSYQKIYPGGTTVAAPEFDYQSAARELAAILAESLVPSETSGLTLVRAVDQSTGQDWSLPALKKGIDFALHQRDGDAERMWALVLFNPDAPAERMWPLDLILRETPAEKDRFRVSERTLAWLKDRALDQPTLDKLAPMASLGPLELVPFRDKLREALGGPTAIESQVLQLSDTYADRVHLNLYAAHVDLYRMYFRDKRFDLAAYHLSRAYAHYPSKDLLDAWVKLQTDRALVGAGVQPGTLFWLYLRIPAPRTALVTAGAFDLAVLPPPALEYEAEALPPLVMPRRAEPPQPAAVQPASRPRLVPGIQPPARPRPR